MQKGAASISHDLMIDDCFLKKGNYSETWLEARMFVHPDLERVEIAVFRKEGS